MVSSHVFRSLAVAVLLTGCNTKPKAKPSPVATTSSAAPRAETGLPALRHAGETFAFRTALVWYEDAAGSRVPQLSLYDQVVPCEARLTTSAKRFYASLLGEEEELVPGELRSPNWGFSGLPVVPGPEGDEGYPPRYWGTVTLATVTDATVSGTLRFASKGLTLEGPFEAKRCPDR